MKIKLFIILSLLPLFIFSQKREIKGKITVKTIHTCSGKTDTITESGKGFIITYLNTTKRIGKHLTLSDSTGNFTVPLLFQENDFDADAIQLFGANKLDTIIPFEKIKDSTISITFITKELETIPTQRVINENIINSGEMQIRVAKPAIYLYPTQEQKITVQLDFKGQLGTTYPKYNQGWNVLAKPNGEILNIADNRKYTYLFWEGEAKFAESHFNYQSGFVVPKYELDKFLLEKLTYIGLNNTEINDFIVYWLPQMEKNEYNLVHFFINDNIDNSAFLNVNPKPESEIRIFMEYKSVDKAYKIEEQKLPKIERKGFTLVEWGGGISGENKIE